MLHRHVKVNEITESQNVICHTTQPGIIQFQTIRWSRAKLHWVVIQ